MKSPFDDELKKYQDAVWAYLVEHSDITREGSYFIKFHTKDRSTFEKHVKGRHKYGYHRIDDRTEETHEEKERRATATQQFYQAEKKRKKEAWKASREERARVFAELKRANEKARQRESRRLLIHSAKDATASITVVLLRHIRHAYVIAKNKVRNACTRSEESGITLDYTKEGKE